ncbi:MAG: amidase [Candidatus Rokubacteria bacterium]|nr:amidase [Candidatus Rokubacteria bacterium]
MLNTRESFRSALERLHRYAADSPERRPAFGLRLPEIHRGELEAVREAPPLGRGTAGPGLTIAGAAARIREGRLTARELVEQCIERIHRLNGSLRAFTCVLEEEARRQAAALDAEARAGSVRGPLHGVPVAVKDVIHVAGVPTTASSRAMTDVLPEHDAAAVARLRAAGAVIVGKTETHEFALGVTTPQSRNPWDPSRLPGGSSGGSAIALATGMSLGALGTDTRASIRMPAALSGVVGFKPTFGLVSTWGVVTLSWSMDHVGPMATTVEDAALLLNALVGHDPRDPASVDRPREDFTRYLGRRVEGLTVGVPAACLADCDGEVKEAFARAEATLAELGVRVVSTAEPRHEELEAANAAGLIVSRCEAASFHRERFAARSALYTRDVFEQLDEAHGVPAVDYLQAQRLRREFAERMLRGFEGIEALAMPTAPVPAPKADEAERYLTILSRNCVPWSFVGFPAISLPCGRTAEGLPIGLQLVGAPFADGLVLALASAFEAMRGPAAG